LPNFPANIITEDHSLTSINKNTRGVLLQGSIRLAVDGFDLIRARRNVR